MSLADKINQLSLIKTKFADLGDHSLDVVKALQSENEVVDHYRKLFKDREKFDNLFDLNEKIQSLLLDYYDASNQVKKQINSVVYSKERNILQNDHIRYATQTVDQELIDKRNENISQDFIELVKNAIQRYSDWRFAGCVLHPTDEQFVQDMVACEPLYVVSTNDLCVGRVKENLNDFYVTQRLRVYDSLKHLPPDLGLTVCINQFEYIPLDEQSDILTQVYNHTLPGGRMILTYNDCDQRQSLEHTLEGLRFYSTKELLLGKAYSIGWNVISTETINGLWQYALLEKEGQMDTIKTSAPVVSNIRKGVTWQTYPNEGKYTKRILELLKQHDPNYKK